MYDLQGKIVSLIVKVLEKLLFWTKVNPCKITYISYLGNDLPYNMRRISEELKTIDNSYKEVYLSMKFDNTLLNKIKYFFEIIKQVIHIKTSKTVIIDGNNIVISNIEHSNNIVIQIWHASAAIKKFGKDYNRKFPITKCDYMITTSSKFIDIMASAFDISKKQVIPLGYIDSGVLFDEDKICEYRTEMYNKYPNLKNKKVILYAPTFRGDAVYEKKGLHIDLNKIVENLNDEYVVIHKMHPILCNENVTSQLNLYNMNNENIYKLFTITDILVSDFSSIIMDFIILERPIILYTPDLEEYEKQRGLYVDYKSFAPGNIVYNESELIEAINNEKFDIDKVKKLKEYFYDYKDNDSAKRIAKFIYNIK